MKGAIDAAVAAIAATGKGAVVQLPAGIGAITSTSPTQPTNPATGSPYSKQIGIPLPVGLQARLTIRGMGHVFWIAQQADYDVFKNLTFEDFTVDNNNAIGRCHVLVGTMPSSATSQRRLSFEGLRFRRLHGINIPRELAQTTTAKAFVKILGFHPAALEATQTHTTDVLAEEVVMEGGAGGLIVCSSPILTGGINHYYDNIKFHNCHHSNGAAASQTSSETSFYICGSGFGDYCSITKCSSTNIADDAIEIGAMQRVVIDDFRTTDPFLTGILFRNTHALQSVAQQHVTVCDYRCTFTSALTGISANCRPFDWSGDDGLTFGRFEFENFQYNSTGLAYSKQGSANLALTFDKPVASILLDSPRFVLDYAFDVAAAGTYDIYLIDYNPAATGTELIIRDIDIAAVVTASAGASASFILHLLNIRGTGAVLELDGYGVDLSGSSFTNSTGATLNMLTLNGVSLRATASRIRPRGPTAGGFGSISVIRIGSGATLHKFKLSSCDFGRLNAAAANITILSPGPNTTGKTYVQDVIGTGGTTRLGVRTPTAANLTMAFTDRLVAVTSTAAARTITPPTASAVPVGDVYTVVDESNGAATNNITVSGIGTIATNGGKLSFYSDGVSWHTL